jgi:hypothetical protein
MMGLIPRLARQRRTSWRHLTDGDRGLHAWLTKTDLGAGVERWHLHGGRRRPERNRSQHLHHRHGRRRKIRKMSAAPFRAPHRARKLRTILERRCLKWRAEVGYCSPTRLLRICFPLPQIGFLRRIHRRTMIFVTPPHAKQTDKTKNNEGHRENSFSEND